MALLEVSEWKAEVAPNSRTDGQGGILLLPHIVHESYPFLPLLSTRMDLSC